MYREVYSLEILESETVKKKRTLAYTFAIVRYTEQPGSTFRLTIKPQTALQYKTITTPISWGLNQRPTLVDKTICCECSSQPTRITYLKNVLYIKSHRVGLNSNVGR